MIHSALDKFEVGDPYFVKLTDKVCSWRDAAEEECSLARRTIVCGPTVFTLSLAGLIETIVYLVAAICTCPMKSDFPAKSFRMFIFSLAFVLYGLTALQYYNLFETKIYY